VGTLLLPGLNRAHHLNGNGCARSRANLPTCRSRQERGLVSHATPRFRCRSNLAAEP